MSVSNSTREHIYAYFDQQFNPNDVDKYWENQRAANVELTEDNLLVFVDGTMSIH